MKKAKEIKGTRFFHIYAPCPTGWKSRPEDTVKLARMAVQNGIFPLFEIEDGEKYTLNLKLKDKKPVDDYIRLQGRFRHLKPEQIAARCRPRSTPAGRACRSSPAFEFREERKEGTGPFFSEGF